jgi:hypothetical protein
VDEIIIALQQFRERLRLAERDGPPRKPKTALLKMKLTAARKA